jgi:hypothetical protein
MALTRSRSHTRIATWLMGLSYVSLMGCAIVGQTEYQDFKPMPANARVMNQVKLSWEVRTDAGAYCLRSQKNRGNLQGAEPIACAIWSPSTNECRVITGPNPNHVVLGHEVRHCFEGHFH